VAGVQSGSGVSLAHCRIRIRYILMPPNGLDADIGQIVTADDSTERWLDRSETT
jgi:hypothetical protein